MLQKSPLLPFPFPPSDGVMLAPDAIPYGAALAASLLRYAGQDPLFAAQLAQLTATLPEPLDDVPPGPVATNTSVLMPQDDAHAINRMLWLLQRLNQEALPGGHIASDMLAAWARAQRAEEPRQLVVGVMKIAIPGITLGRLTRKVEAMSVLVRPDMLRTGGGTLLKGTTKTVLNTFGQALQLANGDIRNLEPEILDWFLGEKEIAFYVSDRQTLADIAGTMECLDVPHAGAVDEDGYGVLAISPIVRGLERWDLSPIT